MTDDLAHDGFLWWEGLRRILWVAVNYMTAISGQ